MVTRSGLIFPRDLEGWARWQRRQHPLRRLRSMIRRRSPQQPWLAVRGTSPSILIAIDAGTPTQRAALGRPLELLDGIDAAVLLPSPLPGLLPSGGWEWCRAPEQGVVPEALLGVRAVLSAGHYLPMGALGNVWAEMLGAERVVVQHGLLTPHAPPLPGNARLLAFTDADASFAMAGRDDLLTATVGSQLLWEAGAGTTSSTDDGARPLYLGQLHGAELPRGAKARAAEAFCQAHGASYRPHPAETDLASRWQHRGWERRGITIDRSERPISELDRPIVSAFSTGVLEAAARGRRAWVSYPRPPQWLTEFWDRYAMGRWGGESTPAPHRPTREPAAAIVRHVGRAAGIREIGDTSKTSRGRRR